MKKTVLFLAIALFGMTAVVAQSGASVNSGANITLDKDVHDYGEIEKGGDPYCEFTITNDGSEPLIITNAKGSCGCTVPKWPKMPIMPGESYEMEIVFNSKGKSGRQNKTVTIQANTEPNPTRLTVKAHVIVPEKSQEEKEQEIELMNYLKVSQYFKVTGIEFYEAIVERI